MGRHQHRPPKAGCVVAWPFHIGCCAARGPGLSPIPIDPETAVAQLRSLLAIAARHPEAGEWVPPILKTTARTAEGVPALVDAIDAHQQHIRTSTHAAEERRALAERQVVALARAALHRAALAAAAAAGVLAPLVDDVATRARDPRSAAEALLRAIRAAWAAESADGTER